MSLLAKISIVMSLMLFFLHSNAQVGIKAGLTLAKFSEKSDFGDYTSNHTIAPGFHIGAVYNTAFGNFLSFEPGLIFTTKGSFYEREFDDGVRLKQHISLYYLDVPINLKGSFELSESFAIYLATGPYFGVGISGNNKTEIIAPQGSGTESESFSDPVKWGSGDLDNLQRLDFGLSFGLGIEVNSILFGISYDHGMANIAANNDNGYSIKNRVIKVSLGYYFGGDK